MGMAVTFVITIRENITPRGDGNKIKANCVINILPRIRENITPRGDGNLII